MKFIFRDRIHDEVTLQMDAAPGSHEWLAKYPAALSKVYKELDDDEMAQCEQTLEEWVLELVIHHTPMLCLWRWLWLHQ